MADDGRDELLADYRRRFGGRDDAAPGWDAIDARLREVYGTQEPKHYGTVIKHMLGGPDPIDGLSLYACRDGPVPHWHVVTYGYSSLYYDEAAVGGEFSRFGFEMTFLVADPPPPAEPPMWALDLLQNLARYVFKSGRWFEPGHYCPANGPLKLGDPTALVGLAFAVDPALAAIDTPHGRVEFVQAFGITAGELARMKIDASNVATILDFHRRTNPLLVTDLTRADDAG